MPAVNMMFPKLPFSTICFLLITNPLSSLGNPTTSFHSTSSFNMLSTYKNTKQYATIPSNHTTETGFNIGPTKSVSPTSAHIIQKSQQTETMLRPDPGRFVLFPIKQHRLWELYKKHVASFWTVDEVDLSLDISDWRNKLNDNERHFIQMILAFFAGSYTHSFC